MERSDLEMVIKSVLVLMLFASGYLIGWGFSRPAASCVRVTADVTKAEIDGFVYDLDSRGEWSVLVEPDGEYTVIARPRKCETK